MIKTWQQRCEEHPDHDGIVSEGMIQARMQEEIDELRAAIEQTHDWDEVEALQASLREHMAEIHRLRQWQGLTDEDVDEVERWIEFKEDGSGRIPNQKLIRYIEAKLKAKNL